MVANFILCAVASYVVRNVGPGPETVYLTSFQQEQLLVGAPFGIEYGYRVLFNNFVGMGGGLVVATGGAARETLHAKVVLVAGGVCASYAYLDMNV